MNAMGAKHIETISNETKTTKMNKPKFNIDAHAYWLLCEGQQVEVDGQKIQLTIVDEAKKTINLDSTDQNNVPTERQAKQLAATIKLMTIMHDANGGEWVPNQDKKRVIVAWNPAFGKGSEFFCYTHKNSFYSPIYFRDYETAQRAYEENKQVFNDYFGIGGENE